VKNKILNIKKMLNTWQQRNLTLYGKINIIKTLGISKFINLLSFSAPCPRSLYPRNKQTNFQLYLAREAPTKETP